MSTYVLLQKEPFLDGKVFNRHYFRYTNDRKPIEVARNYIRNWLKLDKDHAVSAGYNKKLGIYHLLTLVDERWYFFELIKVADIGRQ